MREICIGTRDSALAVVQARMVESYINEKTDRKAHLLTMKTMGDKILDRPLEQIGGKGLFMKELDIALQEGRSQLSVHSLKDIPMDIPHAYPILGVSEREDPRDVLVLPLGVKEVDWTKPIGCSGRRRILQMGRLFPQAECKSIRGNVLTRLDKLDRGEYGALILAAAGLKRLGLEERISRYFEPEEMLPAAGQGVLGIQGPKEEDWTFMEGFWSERAWWETCAERAFVRALDGGCSSPIAAYAVTEGEELYLRGLYYEETMGRGYRIQSIRGPRQEAEALGIELAKRIKTPGKVWLVGAGPGDGELLTLKGARLLGQADAVVYDALAGMTILSWVAPDADLIYAGKRAGNHAMSQDAINARLEELALEGKQVVRLKGGDPFLFGRGGEEMQYLQSRGIPCEMVPGVTSALAVPAYNGIPLTHRDYSGSVHIITGHKKEDSPDTIDYEALCKAGGTYVFLMGAGRLKDICRGFLEAGMAADTPAALLAQGTTAGQGKVVAELSTLEDAAEQAGLSTPAIIVIGGVCQLSDELEWIQQYPLFGTRVILTAPAGRSEPLAGLLRGKGAEVVELPAIRLVRRKLMEEADGAYSGEVGSSCSGEVVGGPLSDRIVRYKWLVFTSPSGVDFFLEDLEEEGFDLRRLHGIKLAALGRGTAARLERKGLYPDLVPERAMQEDLGELLLKNVKPGEGVLLLRGAEGRDILPRMLKDGKDIRLESLTLYDTRLEEKNAELFCQLGGMKRDRNGDTQEDGRNRFKTIWVFTSSLGAKAVAHAIGEEDCQGLWAACIGSVTGDTASGLGMMAEVAESASPHSLLNLIEGMIKNKKIKK